MAGGTLQPSRGLLTWNSEGNNDADSKYFSRRAHWPGGASGVTIGRGYDMKLRQREIVKTDLITAGLSTANANVLAEGAGRSGSIAKTFVERDDVKAIEISEEQQVLLFEMAYAKYYADAHRLCMKKDVVKKYGECDWGKMDARVRELITDLHFRGDYSPTMRQDIQKDLLSGDLKKIIKSLERIQVTARVPKDRHDRRIRFLETGIK